MPDDKSKTTAGAGLVLSASAARSRRGFLSLLAGGAAAVGTGGYVVSRRGWPVLQTARQSGSAKTSAAEGVDPSATAVTPLDVGCPGSRRNLVVVELSGGNDGLATLIPYGNGTLNDLRPGIGYDPEELVILDDTMALNPGLRGLHEQGSLAFLQGVGTPNPSGSHFEMERRWWAGEVEGYDMPTAGFLGRLCDELDEGAPLTGLSVGATAAPILYAAKAATMGMRDPDMAWFLSQDEPWFKNLRRGMADLAGAADEEGEADAVVWAARNGLASALDFATVLDDFRQEDEEDSDRPEYPGGGLSDQLQLAADVLGANTGVRIVHVPFGGFDTHEDQRGSHEYLLTQLSESLVAFREDLSRQGLGDDTLIATVSEFGRRPDQNGSGTDHGAASVAMLAGPVVAGLHGEAPSLTRLDDDDNLRATVRMDEYYATLAQWMGIDHRTVLTGNPAAVDGLVLPCQPA